MKILFFVKLFLLWTLSYRVRAHHLQRVIIIFQFVLLRSVAAVFIIKWQHLANTAGRFSSRFILFLFTSCTLQPLDAFRHRTSFISFYSSQVILFEKKFRSHWLCWKTRPLASDSSLDYFRAILNPLDDPDLSISQLS